MSELMSAELAGELAPLLEAVPINEAMRTLVVRHAVPLQHKEIVETLMAKQGLRERPALCAGIWLYVDGLHESHAISQKLPGPTGAFWHGIMHRREGDFGNAKYWFHQAQGHPLLVAWADYDPFGFVDEVQSAPSQDHALAAKQREEWVRLMQWCYENHGQ